MINDPGVPFMSRNPTRRWRQRSTEEWQTLLNRFAASGLAVSAFCQREAISEGSFYRWRAQLAGTASVKPSVVPPFVDLGALLTHPASDGRLELRLDFGAGVTLTLVRG